MSKTAASEDLPDVEKPEQQNFVKFFQSLETPEEHTIRLFEREANDAAYYTCHGDDAHYVAQQVFETVSVIKYWFGDSETGLPTTKLTNNVAETFMRDVLLNKQLKIEIWKQQRLEWQLQRKASPGNLQAVEDILFANKQLTSAPVVMAVKYSVSGDQKVYIHLFFKHTQQQSLVIQLGVKECLLMHAEKDYENTKIRGILDRCQVVVTERKRNEFDARNITQDLSRLLESETTIEALRLLDNDNNFSRFTLKHHDLSQYMRLDGPALAALNLLPTAKDGPTKSTSVYGLLNKCCTAQGSRLFAQWLKQPLLNLEEIKTRQAIQEDHLKYVPDLHRLAKRFQKGLATLQDVIRIYQLVIRLPALIECLEARPHPSLGALIESTYTGCIREYTGILQKLEELVVTTIDLEALENHEYIIKAEFNEELQELYTGLQKIDQDMRLEYRKVSDKLNLEMDKKLKLEKHSLYGYCFRVVGRTEASRIRNKTEYMELSTQKSGTFFRNQRLKQLNESHSTLSKEYEEKQRGLVKEVLDITATYCPTLEALGSVLAHLDVLVSFAHVSVMAPIPYVRPTMYPCGQGDVVLEEARHPCLEVQDYVSFIPNDVHMIRDTSEFQIITGPNMGGKSTYIRQVGVIALMAQIGCFVPCTKATLCVFDSILARVGAGDSQLKGVSTFMAEMMETSTILKAASRNSLVIIDELGRGTSTYDGLGLAWAISEYIATKIRAFCMFATHFHELTTLSETQKHVKNLHVAVHVGDDHEVTLLYKVKEGFGDRSFGIHVAELAKFPKSVVALAKRKADELDDEADMLRGAQKQKLQSVAEGEALIEKMVQEMAAVSTAKDAEDQIEAIKQKYQADIERNDYLRELLLAGNPYTD
ncbi:muts domain V-domain-containing protein [Blakeslea trispora]|nr:muts domain V-domain-containing protein [Blakeslea trispora]